MCRLSEHQKNVHDYFVGKPLDLKQLLLVQSVELHSLSVVLWRQRVHKMQKRGKWKILTRIAHSKIGLNKELIKLLCFFLFHSISVFKKQVFNAIVWIFSWNENCGFYFGHLSVDFNGFVLRSSHEDWNIKLLTNLLVMSHVIERW